MRPGGKISRRALLGTTLGALSPGLVGFGGAALSPRAMATPIAPVLNLTMAHTGERFEGAYRSPNGQIFEPAKQSIDVLLRDWRTGAVTAIDPHLLDTLAALSAELQPLTGEPPEFTVFSGYRSRETNMMLFRTRAGVAWNSFHILGKAIDFRILDLDFATQREAADRLVSGGLGSYPSSGFLHIDTGPARRWGGGTGGGGGGDGLYEGVVIAGLPPELQPGTGGLIHRGGIVQRGDPIDNGGIVFRGSQGGTDASAPTIGGLPLGTGSGNGGGLIGGGDSLINRGNVPSLGGLRLDGQ